MSKRAILSSIFAVSMATLVGCGGSSGGGGSNIVPGVDSGTSGSQDSGISPGFDSSIAPQQDSSVPTQDSSIVPTDSSIPPQGDAAMDASVDANITPPTGTPVVLGANLNLWGVTDDGFAIYSDETANVLYALSITGTTPVTVAMDLNGEAGDQFHFITISHKVVFIFVSTDSGTGLGTLSTWTSAAAAPTAVSTTSAPYTGNVASSDSALIAYFDNYDGNLTTDILGATVTGGSHKTVAAGIDLTGTSNGGPCDTTAAFAGASYLVLTHCLAAASAPTISTYHGTGGWIPGVDLTTAAASGFTIDSTNTHVAFSDAAGLEVSPIATKTLKLIDATGSQGGVFNPAGTSILYAATAGLVKSPIATATPATLASGIIGLWGSSPDGNSVLAFEMGDTTDGTDMWLASATTAGAPTQAGMGTTDFLGGDSFTADSSHALFVDFTGNNPILNAFPTTGGTTPTVLTPNVSFSQYFAATTSKVVFGANPGSNTTLSNGDGTADLMVADTATSAAPTLIANQANADFFLSPAKDKIVYIWDDATGAKAGLYVTAVP